MRENLLSPGVFCDHPSLVRRLMNEFMEACREFHKDPKRFLMSISDRRGGHRRRMLFRFGLGVGLLVYAITFTSALIFWTANARPSVSANGKDEITILLPPIHRLTAQLPESDRKAQGGGGGGDHSLLPATGGERPLFSPDHPIMAPTTKPQIKPPVLPMIETLLGDPSHNIQRDDLLPTGIPGNVIGPPSDGPGSNGGIGTGKDGGVGSGKKAGFGPGENGGQGGNSFAHGGNPQRNRIAEQVDTRPIPLNRPRPNYTEEARKIKIEGTVRVRALINEEGRVERVKVIRGLPAGLTEEAIRAASQMRFRPATKDGQKVAHWMLIDIEFNLR